MTACVVQASIARIGANVLTEPAAPSTYQPPAIPEPQPTTSSRGRSGSKLHRRTGSVDVMATPSESQSATSTSQHQERSSSVTRDGNIIIFIRHRMTA